MKTRFLLFLLISPLSIFAQSIDEFEKCLQFLHEGYSVQTKVSDENMGGKFSKENVVVFSNVSESIPLKVKDVVVVQDQEQYLLRRITKIKDGVLTLKGDSQKKSESIQVKSSNVVAVVNLDIKNKEEKTKASEKLSDKCFYFVKNKDVELNEFDDDYFSSDYYFFNKSDGIIDFTTKRKARNEEYICWYLSGETFSMFDVVDLIKYAKDLEGFDESIIEAESLVNEWYKLGYIKESDNADEVTYAEGLKKLIWEDFRRKHPNNLQTEVIKTFKDGSCVIILTEPSEEVSLSDIESLFKGVDYNIETYQRKVGYDGWIKDAVLTLKDVSSLNMSDFKVKLFNTLYDTDYKADLCEIDSYPKYRPYNSDLNLNLQVGAEELKSWMFENGEVFVDNSGNKKTIDKWLNEGSGQAVLNSEQSGLVLWIVEKKNNNKDFKVNARKFSLDTDLILGAVEKGGRVAIVGRKRIVPTTILPPMRPETIMLLASTKEFQLCQSYERMHFFAGKLPGGKDVAPILLSDELWHTEYGSLLNITDQMLKSWSMNGQIEYENFSVEKPLNYPFFEGANFDLNANTITFNWNTSGAGYEIQATKQFPYNIYALNRTGSLPISYIPDEDDDNVEEDDAVFNAEETAYDYYSQLCNPELIKVVQYASLYQIFYNYGVKVEGFKPYAARKSEAKAYSRNAAISNINHFGIITDFDKLNSQILETKTDSRNKSGSNNSYLGIIANFDKPITLMLDSIMTSDKLQSYDKLLEIFGYEKSNLSGLQKTLNLAKSKFAEELKRPGNFLLRITSKDDGSTVLDSIANHILNVGEIKYTSEAYNQLQKSKNSLRANLKKYSKAQLAIEGILDIEVFIDDLLEKKGWPKESEILIDMAALECIKQRDNILCFGRLNNSYDLSGEINKYVKDNKNSQSNWIKCPTVVLSYNNRDSVNMTGGHNIVSKITPIRIDNTLRAGQFKIAKVNGQKVIFVATSDAKNITPSILRKAERTKITGLQSFKAAPKAIRPRAEVIPIDAKPIENIYPEIPTIKVDNRKIDKMLEDVVNQMADGERKSKHFIIEGINERETKVMFDNGAQCIIDKGNSMNLEMEAFDFNVTIRNMPTWQ